MKKIIALTKKKKEKHVFFQRLFSTRKRNSFFFHISTCTWILKLSKERVAVKRIGSGIFHKRIDGYASKRHTKVAYVSRGPCRRGGGRGRGREGCSSRSDSVLTRMIAVLDDVMTNLPSPFLLEGVTCTPSLIKARSSKQPRPRWVLVTHFPLSSRPSKPLPGIISTLSSDVRAPTCRGKMDNYIVSHRKGASRP